MIPLACRSLLRHRARTLLALLAVGSAAALLFDMFMLSNGFQESLASVLSRTGYQLRLIPIAGEPLSGNVFKNGTALTQRIEKLPHVTGAIPLFLSFALVSGNPRGKLVPVEAFGFRVAARPPPFFHFREGRSLSGSSGGVIINARLARAAGLGPGKKLWVYGSGSSFMDLRTPVPFRITGVAQFELEGPHDKIAGFHLADLQGLKNLEKTDPVSVVLVRVDNDANAVIVSSAIRKNFPGVKCYAIPEFVASISRPLLSLDAFSMIMRVVAAGMAFLFLFVFLALTVHESLGELAGLRALGFQARRVFLLVMAQGIVLAILGTALGLPFGYYLSGYLNHLLHGFGPVPEELKFFVPRSGSVLASFVLMILVGASAGLPPAVNAYRLNLIEILHQELER